MYGCLIMEILRVPLNVWNKDSIRPGAVGSVGETNLNVRLKQSCIELDPRYSQIFNGRNEKYFGANISDGTHAGFTSGGGVAKTLRKPLGYRPGFRTVVGWRHQDVRPVDRSRTSIMGDGGQYSWQSKVAQIHNARKTGGLFAPEPRGYAQQKGQINRGGNAPVIVAASVPNAITPPVISKNLGSYAGAGEKEIRKLAYRMPRIETVESKAGTASLGRG